MIYKTIIVAWGYTFHILKIQKLFIGTIYDIYVLFLKVQNCLLTVYNLIIIFINYVKYLNKNNLDYHLVVCSK